MKKRRKIHLIITCVLCGIIFLGMGLIWLWRSVVEVPRPLDKVLCDLDLQVDTASCCYNVQKGWSHSIYMGEQAYVLYFNEAGVMQMKDQVVLWDETNFGYCKESKKKEVGNLYAIYDQYFDESRGQETGILEIYDHRLYWVLRLEEEYFFQILLVFFGLFILITIDIFIWMGIGIKALVHKV